MHVLEHDPVSVSGGVEQGLFGSQFLALSHGNIGESSIGNWNVYWGGNLFDFWSGVDPWEQHEEEWGIGIWLFVGFKDIEWLLLDVFFSHWLIDEQSQGRE